MRSIAGTYNRLYLRRIMRNSLKPLKHVEDHRARICLDMVCEFMRTKTDDDTTKTIQLMEFQQRIGTKILSPNESQEYEKYRKKYREQKKQKNTFLDNKQLLKEKRQQARTKSKQ